MNNVDIVTIVNKHIKGHSRGCTFSDSIADNAFPESDYCTCNIYKRKIGLYNDIAKLLGCSLYDDSKDKAKND